MEAIRFTATREEHIAGFHACVDSVARERLYLGFVEGPPLAASQEFVRQVVAGGGVHIVAIDACGEVVGWCDIVRDSREGFRHSGRLGIGLVPPCRGAGLGRGFAETAVRAAWERGLERIALEVFASNTRAIALYERLGFGREGVRRRARKLDGRYDDEVLMALVRDPSGGTEVRPSTA
jgi:RimJ/RimL family protein N-acetyltransferase